MSSSSPLLKTHSLGALTLSNRVVMAPLTRARAGSERIPNDLMCEHYTQRASAGLIIAEATVISPQGIGWVDSPGIYNEDQVEGWKAITSSLHEKDCPIFLQLWHCGRASHSSFHDGKLPVSSSAIKINSDEIHTPNGKEEYETPHALETEEVKAVIEDYRRAAKHALEAGFDGIEIHSANGYLLNQFLESKTNHRTDEYGGSLENRLRLLSEVIDAILTIWPAEKIGVRLSPNGVFNDMGSPDYRETYFAAASLIDRKKLGYLHVMDGLAFGFHELGEPITLAEIRQFYHGTLMGNCGYTQESAEQAITNGHADLIAFGRPYITNPDLVERFTHSHPLAPDADTSVWSAPGPDGYIDFPRYRE